MSTKTAVIAPSPMMKDEKSRSVLSRDEAASTAQPVAVPAVVAAAAEVAAV